jgi:hypothetical protein
MTGEPLYSLEPLPKAPGSAYIHYLVKTSPEIKIAEKTAELSGSAALVGEVMTIAETLENTEVTPSVVQSLSMQFIAKRLRAASTAEDIRMHSLQSLMSKLPNNEFSVSRLMRIIEGLGNQGAVDMTSIIAASKSSGAGDKNKTTNIFNFGAPSEPAPAPANKSLAPANSQVLGLLGDLMQISESVTSLDGRNK